MDNHEQGTLGWFRSRMGNITGSRVGLLMKKPKIGDGFTDTAMSYIYQVLAERTMNPIVIKDDDFFAQYLEQVNVTSKAMRWGNEQEDNARTLYTKIKGVEVHTTGSVSHNQIEHFASSPDGYIVDDTMRGCIEIKCPNQNTYMKYITQIFDADSLKKVNDEYYWQCMAHMSVTGAKWCDFITYCPFQNKPIHIIRIERNEEEIELMEQRVRQANKLIEEIRNTMTKTF